MTERKELIIHICEGFKDAYGMNWAAAYYDFDSMTDAELEAEADKIGIAIERAITEEAELEAEALADFETEIDNICYHAVDGVDISREQAIRWLLDAHDLADELDPEYICHRLGLAYSKADLFEEICKEK